MYIVKRLKISNISSSRFERKENNVFNENLQIMKVHGGRAFLDVRAAFTLGEGKVAFKFNRLDQNNKVSQKVDCYLDMDEFVYLTRMITSGEIYTYLQKHRQYTVYGGKAENGAAISRQFKINLEIKMEKARVLNAKGEEVETEIANHYLYFKGLQGPGVKKLNGAITPNYSESSAQVNIAIRMDVATVKTMGYAFERAIKYYDEWNIAGVLKERCDALHNNELAAANKTAAPQNYSQQNYNQPAYNQQSYNRPAYNQQAYTQVATQVTPQYSQPAPVYSQQAYN